MTETSGSNSFVYLHHLLLRLYLYQSELIFVKLYDLAYLVS